MHLNIIILGVDCSKCNALLDRIQKIVSDNALDASVEKITDTGRLISYGICSVPAIVINGKVVSRGIVPAETEIIKLLNEFLADSEKLTIPLKKNLNKRHLFTILFLIIFISVLLAIVFLTKNKTGHKDKDLLSESSIAPLSIADSLNLLYNYTRKMSTYQITFLEFGSKGCIECNKMEKVMKEIKEKYKGSVNVVFYDVRMKENKKTAKHFGIQLIPVQILLDKTGKECFRHIGYFSFNELENEFLKFGVSEIK
ncbi:MAG TPA: MTH895/ArsE family thioredoxin-like protein [Bacteroidales bacterium]|nr:MTH895/ArsE family thioredoxin-like protein [Bacteroidales bacterium]